ncbi:hypothetical protein WICPIJ_009538 [Wickerhamomyces pijperi]|uniref:Uncharacterized protein n=1 Tax=Wickerhamomyces pijperi TaxID=599730 RepID=A0A9P8PN92_WICPI|nr:hypothetical protein WICPIJ_009538 [Wickerhamomyces pijperi]
MPTQSTQNQSLSPEPQAQPPSQPQQQPLLASHPGLTFADLNKFKKPHSYNPLNQPSIEQIREQFSSGNDSHIDQSQEQEATEDQMGTGQTEVTSTIKE